MGKYNYVIVDDDDFPPEVSKMLNEAAEEAERGYSLSFLRKCRRGRPLKVGSSPASHTVQVRLDDDRAGRLKTYARQHGMTQSEAMRDLFDKGLAAA